MRFLLTVLFAALLTPIAHAQIACPYLTLGTAAFVLGATPELTVKTDLKTQLSTCLYTASPTSNLEISVANDPFKDCPAASPKLAAVGNEAVICESAPSLSTRRITITSRVRTLYFLTVLNLPVSTSEDQHRDRTHLIAEQVAGSLF